MSLMLQKLKVLVAIGYLSSLPGWASTASMETIFGSCEHLVDDVTTNVTAYIDWEFKLDCNDLPSAYNSSIGVNEAQCFVKGYGANFTSASAAIRLSGDAPRLLIYSLFLVNDFWCVTRNITVHLKEVPVTSCQNNVMEHLSRDVNVHHVEVEIADFLQLECTPTFDAGAAEVSAPATSPSRYTTQWFYSKRDDLGQITTSCSILEETFTTRVIQHSDRPDSLMIFAVQFWNARVYTCGVTYENRTAFITHHSVCVEYQRLSQIPTLECDKSEMFFEGDPVVIRCMSMIAMGKIRAEDLQIVWKKWDSSTDLCTNNNYSLPNTSSTDRRVTCQINNFANLPLTCYKYEVTAATANAADQSNEMDVHLKISNARKNDVGQFIVQVCHKYLCSKVNVIELQFNPERELQRIGIGLGVTLAMLLTLLFFGMLLRYNWIYVKLWYRRHFRKPEAAQRRSYVAKLVYCSENMNNNGIKRIVPLITEKLNALDYSYFDNHETYEQGLQISTFLKNLDECHRMIVVLTNELIKTPWFNFVVNEGIQRMGSNSTKLVFVRTPRCRTALRDNFKKKQLAAIMACRNIKWDPSVKDYRFQAEVEYALPNLSNDVTGTASSTCASPATDSVNIPQDRSFDTTRYANEPTVLFSVPDRVELQTAA